MVEATRTGPRKRRSTGPDWTRSRPPARRRRPRARTRPTPRARRRVVVRRERCQKRWALTKGADRSEKLRPATSTSTIGWTRPRLSMRSRSTRRAMRSDTPCAAWRARPCRAKWHGGRDRACGLVEAEIYQPRTPIATDNKKCTAIPFATSTVRAVASSLATREPTASRRTSAWCPGWPPRSRSPRAR